MFEKLLANLPYNPAALHQLAFYGKRMRQETSVRRTGLVFIVLTFFVQFFAFVSPPVSTVAYSNNDMINGGFTSQSEAVSTCRNNVKNYKDVLNNFGISCDDVAAASTTTISSTQDSNQLFSMGWLSYGQTNPDTHKATDQVSLNLVNVSEPLYGRKLSSFDTGSSSSYKALVVTSHATGKSYFILYTCGNLVAHGPPAPTPPCKYDTSLLSTDNNCVQPCQYDKTISANSPKCFKPCQYDNSIPSSSAKCFKPCQYDSTIPASSAKCFKPCPIKGEENLPQSSPKCSQPCPYNKAILANNSKCVKPCQYNSAISSDSPQCFPPCTYNKSISSKSASCFPPCQYNKSLSANSPDCFKPCKYNNGISSTSIACVPCTAAVSTTNALACVTVHKTAANLTQNISDANNTTAQPGDTIVYTLYAQNNGKDTIKSFVFEENISDVLDYADITNLYGGTIDSNDEIVWPAVDIKANTTALERVAVKIKNPVPATPVGPSDGGHFDGILTNVYGNTININVPQPPVKIIETGTTELPNTGPGTGLFIAAVVMVIAGYFFARTRLLAEESIIAVQDNVSGGL